MSPWGFVSLITGFSLSGLVFGDTEDPPEETEVRIVKEPEERSLSLRSGWHSGPILMMTEAVASRVTAGCAWATGTTEHAPECPPSPYTYLPHTPLMPSSPHVTSDNKPGTLLCSHARRQGHPLQME